MRFFKQTNINFMKHRKLYFLVSAILIAFSIYSFYTKGLNYGIDFSGGTQLILKYRDPVDVDLLNNVRQKLTEMQLGDVVVHEYGEADESGNLYSILARVEASSEEEQESGEETVDTAEDIRRKLMSPSDLEAVNSGKEDLNSIGKAKLENYLKTSGLAPADNPPYIEQLAEVNVQSELPLTPTEKYYQVLAEQIIEHREKAEVGVFHKFEDVEGANSNPDLVAANSGQPAELINDKVMEKLRSDFYLGSFAVIGVEMVGPSVGSDLRQAAMASIISALIGILIYITIRFKFRFGVAAIIALIHDVIITTGVFAFAGKEYTLSIVAALLTIIGYSLNDTIVVSDRIRENLNILRRESYTDVVNRSINDTISRTVLTSLTTLFVVLCLLFLGGEVLNGFAFALLVGIMIGTYSSICVVSPILVTWNRYTEKYQKTERSSDYVKKSLNTLFPEERKKRAAAKKAEKKVEKKDDAQDDSKDDDQQISKRRKKKGITGKKKKKKKKRR